MREEGPDHWGDLATLLDEALDGKDDIIFKLDLARVDHELKEWLQRLLQGRCVLRHEAVHLAYHPQHVPALVNDQVVALTFLMAGLQLDQDALN